MGIKMKKLLQSKIILGAASGVAILAVTITAICIGTKKPTSPLKTSAPNSKSESGVSIDEINDKIPSISEDTSKPSTNTTIDNVVIDVGGNPVKPSQNQDSAKHNKSEYKPTKKPNNEANDGTSTPPPNPPSVNVDTVPDTEQPKDDRPNPKPPTPPTNPNYPSNPDDWTPPPPGTGSGELISSGLESIAISSDKSAEELYTIIGLDVGSKLKKAGYTTLYPNAGTPKKMVEDAVDQYAKTEKITLSPDKYGLPKIVGYYNVKLAVKGANAAEAAEYIFNYMKNDKSFNDKVKTVFNQYQDGFLTVYQRNGYFYVLFAVIDKDYCAVG